VGYGDDVFSRLGSSRGVGLSCEWWLGAEARDQSNQGVLRRPDPRWLNPPTNTRRWRPLLEKASVKTTFCETGLPGDGRMQSRAER